MKKIELDGVWIPREILLNDKEKIVLSIVLCLSTELGYCFAGNRYLSNILGVTINRVSKIISSLKDKGFIKVNINYDDEKKYIRSRELKLTDKILKGIVKNNNTYWPKQQYPIVKKDIDIINIYKNNIYNKKKFEENNFTKEELENLYYN